MLFHRDKESITYKEVVTTLLTDNIQKKLVSSLTPSSSSIALHVTRGRLKSEQVAKLIQVKRRQQEVDEMLEVWQARSHEKELS